MENASKALIMAGGILIAIMVISLGVYIFSKFGDFAKNQETQVFEKNVTEFNAQFTKFEGAEDITAQDVVTVINLAKNNNKRYNLTSHETGNYYVEVEVTVGGIHINEKSDSNKLNELLKNNSYKSVMVDGVNTIKLEQYECKKIKYDEITGRVYRIDFKKML